MTKAVLVTGGAGYIGAHACKALAKSGYLPVVYDDLSLGHAAHIKWGPHVRGDIRDRTAIEAHEAALRDRAMAGLRELNWVKLHGAAADKGAIVAFSVEGAHPHDVAQILDRQGVAVRAGHHCAQPLMARLGVTATARASFACYNRLEEVDALIEALHKARKLLG